MKLRILALSLCALSMTATSLFAQKAENEIPGTFNPHTGLFRARAAVEPTDAAAVTSTFYSGTLSVPFTIALKTTVPSGDEVLCEVSAEVFDAGTGADIAESASAVATISGTTATCTVKIPYSWYLSSATDQVSWSYGAAITPTTATATTSLLFSRSSSHSGTPFTVPKTGTLTSKAVGVTI